MALKRNVNKKPARTRDRRNIWLIILCAILIIISVALFTPPNERINMGLDIQGGLSVVLTAKSDDGGTVSDEDLDTSLDIIENRVNLLGASEASVQLQGTDQILVQIPGLSDTEEALATIGKTGSLVFARLDSFTDEDVVSEIDNGSYMTQETYDDDFGYSFPTGDYTYLEVDPDTYTPLITGANIENVTVDRASETSTDYAVDLRLDSEGTKAFAEATADLAADHGKIVIILDNEVQSAPAVQSEITDGSVAITGNYTEEDAQSLATILESGSLPVSFEYAQSQVVGPTLGQEALIAGLIVMLIGLVIVILYLLFFYKGLGIITAAAMVVFAALYLGILAALSFSSQFSLTLAGIAGIVLTIGMAADSSILTLERFREEIRMGRSVRSASITGVRHAILTSIDADLVTLVSALCLFFLATASVRGFGLTLALGIVCDIVMMLVFKAPLIRLLAPRIIARHPGFWGIKDCVEASERYDELVEAGEGAALAKGELGEEEALEAVEAIEAAEAAQDREAAESAAQVDAASASGDEAAVEETPSVVVNTARKLKGRFIKHDINFVGHRRVFLTIAACCMVACFIIVGVRGLNFGIEFIGGSSITYYDTGDITTDQIRDAFDDAGEPDAVVQTTSTNGEPGFLVRTTTTDAEDATAMADDVAAQLDIEQSTIEVNTIGPDFSPGVIRSSLIAFLVSIVLIIIYIAIRFEYKMGIMAIVALLHDLILVMGIYALVGREVNPNTIAALLTILGYSLYDTVVVFHRINDNMKGENIRCTFATMANHSINEVFLRTINTTLTSFVPVLAMLLFGGETLKDFAFAMVIGLLAGSYSSIAVATPLYVIWKTHESRYAKLRRKYGDKIGLFEFFQVRAGGLVQVPLARQAAANKAAAAAAASASGRATTSGAGGTSTGKSSSSSGGSSASAGRSTGSSPGKNQGKGQSQAKKQGQAKKQNTGRYTGKNPKKFDSSYQKNNKKKNRR